MAKTATYRFSRPVIRLFLLSSAACTVAKLYPFRDRGGPTTKDVVEVAILAICLRAMRRVVAAPINRRLWLKHWVMHVVVVAVAGLCLHGSYLLWTAAKMGLSLGVADIVCMLSCAYFSSVFGVSLWHLLPSMIWASNINPSVLVTTTVFALSYLTARVLTFEPDSKDPLPHRSETATDDQANTAIARRNESARRAAAAWSELCSSLTQLPVLMFDCAVVCLRVLLHVFLLAFRRQAGTCRMHIPFICL